MTLKAKAGWKEDSALRALRRLLGRRPGSAAPARGRNPALQADLEAASEWGWESNIAGIFVGEKSAGAATRPGPLCLTFHVVRRYPKGRLSRGQRIPRHLRLRSLETTVLTDVVELGRMPSLQAIGPGAQVGHFLKGAGLLGLIVQKRSGGPLLGLSCAHVIANYGAASAGDPVESPPDLDSDTVRNRVGLLTADMSELSPTVAADVDAALFRFDEPPTLDLEGIGAPNDFSRLSAEDLRARRPAVIRSLPRGLVGGEVTTATGDGVLLADDAPQGRVKFRNLVAYRTENRRGDSGSTVVVRGTRTAVGLHIGGDGMNTAYMVPISRILSRFDLKLPSDGDAD